MFAPDQVCMRLIVDFFPFQFRLEKQQKSAESRAGSISLVNNEKFIGLQYCIFNCPGHSHCGRGEKLHVV